jgi:hypothetical protein
MDVAQVRLASLSPRLGPALFLWLVDSGRMGAGPTMANGELMWQYFKVNPLWWPSSMCGFHIGPV